MGRYALHVENWKHCERCSLSETRTKVALCRGKLPCQVLFIGEAPGEIEDACGTPFWGPAGDLLTKMIKRAFSSEVTYCLTNLVGCIPYEYDDNGLRKASQPEDDAIQACSPRLLEVIDMAQPRVIVPVGRLAETYLKQGYKASIKLPRPIPQVAIVHPAWILRSNESQQITAMQRTIVTLQGVMRHVELGTLRTPPSSPVVPTEWDSNDDIPF